MEKSESTDGRIVQIRNTIGAIPDFPKKGILFRDIFPVFQNPAMTKDCIDVLAEYVKSKYEHIDVIVGLEARGFLFGPMLAQQLNASFVPIRKKGKLPGEVVQVKYSLEYGEDVFEAQKGSVKPGQSVVIVDDLLATGGTMNAAVKLMSDMGADVKEGLVVIELSDLKGRTKVTSPVYSMIQFEGE